MKTEPNNLISSEIDETETLRTKESYWDVIYDIETVGADDEDLVRAITPAYPDFDPSAVKTGDCKTEEAAQEKIERARRAHADQEQQYWQEKMDKRALRPETGRILTIGYLRASEPDGSAVLDDGDGDEETLIRRFWVGYEKIRQNKGHLIGWNSGGGMSTGFDLGYIIKRSWILKIPVPVTVMRGRFIDDTFQDLMALWGLNQWKVFSKLDHAARVLGLGNKTEQACSGAEFAEWYLDPLRKDEAIAYAKLDLVLTRKIYLRISPQIITASTR